MYILSSLTMKGFSNKGGCDRHITCDLFTFSNSFFFFLALRTPETKWECGAHMLVPLSRFLRVDFQRALPPRQTSVPASEIPWSYASLLRKRVCGSVAPRCFPPLLAPVSWSPARHLRATKPYLPSNPRNPRHAGCSYRRSDLVARGHRALVVRQT